MSGSTGGSGSDRRRYPRFPVVEGLIEPITLTFGAGKGDAKAPEASPKSQPAILTNLSAGGMSLITFVEPPHARSLSLVVSLPGFKRVPIEARVVRVHTKGETFNLGLQFSNISKRDENHINDMASDHLDCETRIALGLPEACVPSCRFHHLCQKSQKAPHWPPKV